MKQWHPVQSLAPHFALAAFAASGALNWRAHAEPLSLTLRSIVSFLLTYVLVRACGALLCASASRPGMSQESE